MIQLADALWQTAGTGLAKIGDNVGYILDLTSDQSSFAHRFDVGYLRQHMLANWSNAGPTLASSDLTPV